MEGKAILELANKTMIEKEDTKTKEFKSFVDRARVFVVKSNSQRVINIMENYDTEQDEQTTKLTDTLKWDSKTSISVDYLKILLEFLKKSKTERVTIKLSNDYPAGFDIVNDNGATTSIIIAPSVET